MNIYKTSLVHLGRDYKSIEGIESLNRIEVIVVREESGLSQTKFAKKYRLSTRTLQNWEQGRRQPTGAARVLLTIAYRQPVLFRETVSENFPELQFS